MRLPIDSINKQLENNIKKWVNSVSDTSDTSIFNRLRKKTALSLLTTFTGRAIPFATRNGFKIIDLKAGYIKAFIPLKPNKNHFNAMYAGALFTVAELPGGIMSILSFDSRFFPTLKDFKIEFLKVAKSNVTVEFEITQDKLKELENRALQQGKCAFTLEGNIRDSKNMVVARTYASYQVLLSTKG